MKARLYDHIDLRVRDRARAQKFFTQIMPLLGFVKDESSDEWGAFADEGERAPFFGFTEDREHRPNENRIAFWADSREEVDRIARAVTAAGGRNLEGPQIWPSIPPSITPSFLKIPMGTSSKPTHARLSPLQSERIQRIWSVDTSPAPKVLRPQNRVRYLKLIALFKIGKGALLVILGFSLLFLNARTLWLGALSDWVGDEILLEHSKAVKFLLNDLQQMLAGGALRASGLLALFYAAVLFTEGVGVYLQKRWAEYLMVFATAGLIPLEARHLWHRPSVSAAVILIVNCFIVWFLYLVLRRDPPKEESVSREESLVSTP